MSAPWHQLHELDHPTIKSQNLSVHNQRFRSHKKYFEMFELPSLIWLLTFFSLLEILDACIVSRGMQKLYSHVLFHLKTFTNKIFHSTPDLNPECKRNCIELETRNTCM